LLEPAGRFRWATRVGPNASVDRPRPSRTTRGAEPPECGEGRMVLPEGGARGRTQRLGRTRLHFSGGLWGVRLLFGQTEKKAQGLVHSS